MKFRTELNYSSPIDTKIDYNTNIFSIGSCFTTEMDSKLSELKFSTYHNPFGVLFHPLAIEKAISRITKLELYKSSEVYLYNDSHISWDHHSSFNHADSNTFLETINQEISKANAFLQKANTVIITLGTSFVYHLDKLDITVANCHKIPNSQFTKRLLTEEEIIQSLKNTIEAINVITIPNAKIIFTVSPVRHIKDGIAENNISKARLLSAIYEAMKSFENCEYFPSYEFIMDDLRDYRFYKKDLIHPNEIAIDYIWEKFNTAYFTEETQSKIEEIKRLNSSLNHRPIKGQTIEHKQFLYKLLEKLELMQKEIPTANFSPDIVTIKQQIQSF